MIFPRRNENCRGKNNVQIYLHMYIRFAQYTHKMRILGRNLIDSFIEYTNTCNSGGFNECFGGATSDNHSEIVSLKAGQSLPQMGKEEKIEKKDFISAASPLYIKYMNRKERNFKRKKSDKENKTQFIVCIEVLERR